MISDYSAAMVLASCLMVKGKVVLKNVPRTDAVRFMSKLLGELGCQIFRLDETPHDPGNLEIKVVDTWRQFIRNDMISNSHLALYVMGPLYAAGRKCRFETEPFALDRRVLHTKGAVEAFCASKTRKRLRVEVNSSIEPSMFRTFSFICAAATRGTVTTLIGHSREPALSRACDFLEELGVVFDRDRDGNLLVKGKKSLRAKLPIDFLRMSL